MAVPIATLAQKKIKLALLPPPCGRVKQGRFVILAFLPNFIVFFGVRFGLKLGKPGSICQTGQFGAESCPNWAGDIPESLQPQSVWVTEKKPLAADVWCKMFVPAEWRCHLYQSHSFYRFLTLKQGKCLQMPGHKSQNPSHCHFRNRIICKGWLPKNLDFQLLVLDYVSRGSKGFRSISFISLTNKSLALVKRHAKSGLPHSLYKSGWVGFVDLLPDQDCGFVATSFP